MRARIGSRVVNQEDPVAMKRLFPAQPGYFPRLGEIGIVIELPAPDVLGSSMKVRWFSGHEQWIGSMNRVRADT